MRKILPVLVTCVSFALPLFAADATGTWTGTFMADVQCSAAGSAKLRIAGPVTFAVNEPANSGQVVALGTAYAAFPENILCRTKGAETLPISLNARTDGSHLSNVTVLLPAQGAFRPTGTITNDAISLSGPSDNGGSISINLTRVDSQTPTSFRTSTRYSGTYTYNANFAFRCTDARPITATGNAELIAGDIGRGVSGNFRLSNFPSVGFATGSQGVCGVQSVDPANVQLNATLTAGTDDRFNGFLQIPDFIPVRGTFTLSSFHGVADAPGGGQLILDLKNTDPLKVPEVQLFTATDFSIARGEPTKLLWRTYFADKATIDNGVGVEPSVGSVLVRPDKTTVYTITATTEGGTASKTLTITVNDQPIVHIGDFPDGILERVNQGGGTDSFTLVNRGVAPATVTLTSTDAFYTFAPATFSLGPGSTQRVVMTGKPEPAGVYRGSIGIAATGGGPTASTVKVGMIVVDVPAAGAPKPEVRSRVEVTSSAGQNTSVSVPFTNRGNATLVGIATSKAPFITPPPGLITIAPGQTVPVTYDIDVSQRPIDIPLGAATSKISLLYPGGTSRPTALVDRTTTSTVSTTVTHIVTPTVGPGIPPPLLAGEKALIVAGLANKPNSVGDLLLANIQSTPLSSFALFISGGSGLATSAALPQILPNSSITLPGLMKNVVGTTVTTGTAQLRGTDAARASIAAVQSNTALPEGTYSTALPVLDSSRGVPAQGTVVLTGLQKTSAAQTNVFVQEMSGVPGSYAIDFLDAAGHVLSSQVSQTLDGFGFAELDDAAPANAVAARITNTSSNAKLSAYALVTNPVTNDGWLVTDPGAGSTDQSFVVPIFPAGFGAQTTLYLTNKATTSQSVTVTQQQSPPRRRAVRTSSASPGPTASREQVVAISPLQTSAIPIAATSGVIRITAPAGTLSAAARSVIIAGATAFGSGLPAVPVSAALHSGQSRRFSAIDDASAASRTDEVPSTFRTSVLLAETDQQSVTVRLTLQYTVESGSRTTSTAVATKNYTLAAGQSINIEDLGNEMIGASRSTLGDLRDATLDVEVLSGSGGVLPFVASVDNGSDDLIVRTE